MSGEGARIAPFLALSAALHATVLLVVGWPETRIGSAAGVLQVSMTYRAPAAVASSPAVAPAETSTRRAAPHANMRHPVSASTPVKTRVHRSADPPREITAAAPVTRAAAEPRNSAASAPSSPVTDSVPQGTEEHLRASILRLLSSRFHYPVLARRKGMQGIVKLQVRIESDGRISHLQVQQTSGYPVLDQAALESLQLASVPDAPQWMNGQAIDIIIPVEYRLVGG
jgi:protein TonB